ncbi:MAG: hypothetical protein ACJAT4_003394 [Granulosicoccus sp.]|jgi:hypothetical protein
MKIKSDLILVVLIFLIINLLESCSSNFEYYDDDEMISEIKKIKKNKEIIYLEHKLANPKMDRNELMQYLNEPFKLVFKKRDFEKNEINFALAGRSTSNFGYLNRIENQQLVSLDSAACRYGGFIFLKLKPIQKGEYKIKNYGCRYSSEFEITIE